MEQISRENCCVAYVQKTNLNAHDQVEQLLQIIWKYNDFKVEIQTSEISTQLCLF